MKKMKYLLSAVLAAASMGAAADDATFAGSMLYGYCTTAQSANSFGTGTTAGMAMQFTSDLAKQFAGCRITAIAVANGAPKTNATSMPVTLFTAEALDGTYTVSYSGEMDLTDPYNYKEYPLAEPIEITAGMTPFYVGMTVVCNTTVGYPIVTDGMTGTSAAPGDLYGAIGADGTWSWEQLRSQVGFAAIRVKIEGNNLPANNVSILESHLPTYAKPGETATVGLYLKNNAGNAVESATLTYSVNGGTEQTSTVTLPQPLIYNDYTLSAIEFPLDMPDVEGADLPVTINLTGINGKPGVNRAATANRTASGTYLSLAEGYEKAVVAEVNTGTWCGWCPIGIVGLQKMAEKYPDDPYLIPIGVHMSDAMSTTSYASFYAMCGNSAPQVLINRNVEQYGPQTPYFDFLDQAYAIERQIPALAKPEIRAMSYNKSQKKLTVEGGATFTIPVKGEYALAYVVTEDKVGPYDQTNYFSPAYEQGLTLEGWDDKGTTVSMRYNDVARYIYSFKGVKNSLPEAIEADKLYTYPATFQVNSVSNINNCHIICMVINRATGRIENAVRLPYSEMESAIETVEADLTGAPARYYDLQGRPVTNPRSGQIYITNGKKVKL